MKYDNLERTVQTYVTRALHDRDASCDIQYAYRLRDWVKTLSGEYKPRIYLINREMDLFLARISALMTPLIHPAYCKDVDYQLSVIYVLLGEHLQLDAEMVFPIVKNIIVHIYYTNELYNPEHHIISVQSYERTNTNLCDIVYQLYRLVSDAFYLDNLGSIGIAKVFSQHQTIRVNHRDLIYNINGAELLYYNLSKEKAQPLKTFLKTFLMQLHRDLG
jgi:hypothetical protein